MALARAVLALLYLGAWAGVFASPPDLSGTSAQWVFFLAVAGAHVALGYAIGEWWALLLGVAPAVVAPFYDDPRWVPLLLVAYGFPAAMLLAVGVGFRRRHKPPAKAGA
jgi:hypothetical protein